MPTPVSLVLTVSNNGVVKTPKSKSGANLKANVNRFRGKTKGAPVVKGKPGTPDSFYGSNPATQDLRMYIERGPNVPGSSPLESFEAAMVSAQTKADKYGIEEIVVIGDEELYDAQVAHADLIYVTEEVDAEAGDTKFDLSALTATDFTVNHEEDNPSDEHSDKAYSLKVLKRN